MDFTRAELMAAVLARELRDGELAIMGANSQIPFLACRLAQETHAPNLSFICGGSGAVNPKPERLPASSCDASLMKAEAVLDLCQVIEHEGRPRVDTFFAGGLQIDRHGNCNLVSVGSWERPKLRGPGSVGLPFLSRAGRFVIYTAAHNKRTFVEKVEFVSGPGFIGGRDGWKKRGLPGEGPVLVVTPLCVFAFDEKGEMTAKSIHPGVTAREVQENTGFPLAIPDSIPVTAPPSAKELEVMRRIDPDGVAREMVR